MSTLPLSGLRVVELCWVWSGPLLGQLLADLGAEVIKVEWYKRFDLYRTRGVERLAGKYPERVRREMSQSFHGLNRNKIGVALDLKEPRHKQGLIDLVSKSDMVIENFTAGTMDRLGIGYDVLAAANPAITLLSLAGFGASSRLAEMRAYGLVLSSMSGMETQVVDPLTNEFLGSPTFVFSDPNAATFGLLSAIAAVLEAKQTGMGAHVEISQLEAAAVIGVDDDDELTALADALGLAPRRLPAAALIVAAGDGQHFCVDRRDLSQPDFERVASVASTSPLEHAMAAFDAAGAKAVKVVERPAEFGAGAAREDTLLPTVHPVTGPENIVAAPWWIDARRAPLRKTAPMLGEGNAYVLGKLLGWLPEQYESFEERLEAARSGHA